MLTRAGVANLRRMRYAWRIGYLKVAHCTFLMTSHFYSLIFFLFALHRYFSVENKRSEGVKIFFYVLLSTDIVSGNRTSEGIGARREPRCHLLPPLALKLNFQSIISQTNNGCSLLSLILTKLLFLDITCENIYALSVENALTAHSFSIKKRAKMSVVFM